MAFRIRRVYSPAKSPPFPNDVECFDLYRVLSDAICLLEMAAAGHEDQILYEACTDSPVNMSPTNGVFKAFVAMVVLLMSGVL